MDHEMRSVLAQLELLSHGKTQSFNATARGESETARPFGELNPPHEEFRERWNGAPAERRPEVLKEAREALDTWKGIGRAQEAQEWDEEGWIIDDGEGLSPVECAWRFNTSAQRIRKVRVAKGREAEFGKEPRVPERDDLDGKVLELFGKGMSTRAIALIVRKPKSEVQRIKQRAA
jgi:hypothetical protein